MEVYRHQVGGHSCFVKPRNSPKVLKPYSQTEYEFYERLAQLGSSSTESGPLHVLKRYVPEYYGVTEVQVRHSHDFIGPLITRRPSHDNQFCDSTLVDFASSGNELSPTNLLDEETMHLKLHTSYKATSLRRRRHCDSASCLSDYRAAAEDPPKVASDVASAPDDVVLVNDNADLTPRKTDTFDDDVLSHGIVEPLENQYHDFNYEEDGFSDHVDPLSVTHQHSAASAADGSHQLGSHLQFKTDQSSKLCTQALLASIPCMIHDDVGRTDDAPAQGMKDPNHVSRKASQAAKGAPSTADQTRLSKPLTIHLRYIILQDLVYMYKRPCVLDLKMGRRQRKIGASLEKEKSQLEKSIKTTSHILGFRLCGSQSFNRKTNEFNYKDKYWGRSLTEQTVISSIRNWFWDGVQFYSELIQPLIRSLQTLYDCVADLRYYRFWSSSLLWVYDAEVQDPKARVKTLDVKMIDFANTIILKDNASSDEEYLFGLENLISILQGLYEPITQTPNLLDAIQPATCTLDEEGPSIPPVCLQNSC